MTVCKCNSIRILELSISCALTSKPPHHSAAIRRKRNDFVLAITGSDDITIASEANISQRAAHFSCTDNTNNFASEREKRQALVDVLSHYDIATIR